NGAEQITATVTPVGSTYDNSAQNPSCTGPSPFNALAVADLVLTVYGSNGITVLATANAAPAGQAETITNLQLSGAGTYYVKVSENGTPAESQLYRLNLSAVCPTNPSISQQPASVVVPSAGRATFSIVATNAVAYRWKKNGAALVNGPNISGATGAGLQ